MGMERRRETHVHGLRCIGSAATSVRIVLYKEGRWDSPGMIDTSDLGEDGTNSLRTLSLSITPRNLHR
jgi:hypothetical protein